MANGNPSLRPPDFAFEGRDGATEGRGGGGGRSDGGNPDQYLIHIYRNGKVEFREAGYSTLECGTRAEQSRAEQC